MPPAGTSSFHPFWNVAGAEDCRIGLDTTATVIDGQSLVPAGAE